MRTHTPRSITLAVAAALLAGCSDGGESGSATGERPETIPQPTLDDRRIAPENRRVDLATPTFSNPTKVDNQLFPVSKQESVLLLGRVDGEPFRTEVTLLPQTRIIEWEGRPVETLVSQYVAFLSGRIHEVAYDFYAQDDTGSVWYFGEDVFNFEDGAIVDTHGTWLAGREGPAAMIMPAHPKVGDVYRPENIPGLVFEEVTVEAVDRTLEGPLGPVDGGLVIEEFHLLDNVTERKTFAPGYGEFLTGGDGDVEALALAVPTDGLSEPAPAQLIALERGAADVFDATQSRNWKAASSGVTAMKAAWKRVPQGDRPDRVTQRLAAALDSAARGVGRRKPREVAQASIDVARSALDLQLRYRPVPEIDLARLDLWAKQMLIDSAAGDAAAVNGDFFAVDYIRERIHTALDESERARLDTELEELIGAVADENMAVISEDAQKLRETLSELTVGPA